MIGSQTPPNVKGSKNVIMEGKVEESVTRKEDLLKCRWSVSKLKRASKKKASSNVIELEDSEWERGHSYSMILLYIWNHHCNQARKKQGM